MADISYTNNYSPKSRTDVWFSTWRDGQTVYVKATVSVTLLYSDGYFNYKGEINFNMWGSGANASANIKSYDDKWSVGSPRTRTRECTMSFSSTASSFEIGCNVTVPSGHNSIAMPDQYKWVGAPSFNPPTAPTWCNINPNPCNIDDHPVITWGGASAGSMGKIYYDVELRSTLPSGGWTNWLRISNSQESTSYNEITLRNMNVYGQTPYLGVKYQYQIRSIDSISSASGWIQSPELSVYFNNPTAPTSYTLSSTSIKKDGEVNISWYGASGGNGSISAYELQYRIYNKNTSQWSSWILGYKGSNTNYTFKVPTFYSVHNGTYYIQAAVNKSLVFSVKNASKDNGADIILYTNENHDNQKFNIRYLGNGFYQILNVNSNKSLDVSNSGQTNGTKVLQWEYKGSTNQLWIIRKNSDDTFTILSQVNNLAMDINWDTRNIQMWEDNGDSNKKFNLAPLTNVGSSTVLNNGDLIQFRIRTQNSWGQYSPNYLNTNSVSIRGNQMWININNSWVEGDVYFKTNNSWPEATPYIKVSNEWKEST